MEEDQLHEYFFVTDFHLELEQYGEATLTVVGSDSIDMDAYVNGSYGGARKSMTIEGETGDGYRSFHAYLTQQKGSSEVEMSISELVAPDEHEERAFTVTGTESDGDHEPYFYYE